MHRANSVLGSVLRSVLRCLGLACLTLALVPASAADCAKPLYLTFDTGHMGVAPLVADVLRRQNVLVTFFAANEVTKEGDGSLGAHWAPWWRDRGQEGHAFASHTLDHSYWRSDLSGGRFLIKASAGAEAGRAQEWTSARYCEAISQAARRLDEVTGQRALPLFRAPGGKTSAALLAAAEACGWRHVGWSAAGFLGDELPSDRYPNKQLLKKALHSLRSGDIMVAHLGIWSRQDPWAPAVLEPLIVGLKERGFCFRTLRDHPDFRDWLAKHPR